MKQESETLIASCGTQKCGQTVEISKHWTPGGVNDYGGYVLKCKGCGAVFSVHVGRDIHDSRVVRGAELLDTYDDELGNRAEILAKHGIRPA